MRRALEAIVYVAIWYAIVIVAGILLGMATGCCGNVPPSKEISDRQGQAMWTVWTDRYDEKGPPPCVRWKWGSDLTCMHGDDQGFKTPVGCRRGFTWSPFEVIVAWTDKDMFISDTAFAHELMHASMARHGVVDPEHKLPEWEAVENCLPGAPASCGAVEKANYALQVRGL